MAVAIEIQGLRKEYRRTRGGKTVAIDGLELEVQAGGVFGFLGPNGSGKTTTMRCLLGLVRPSSGRVRVLGADVPASLARVVSRVGSVIETPALFPTMTARENLRLLARMDRIGMRRVDDVLEQVGLAERADEAVRRFSLGMRQRLGIGAALLRDPELLVLDEPANGLDPAGIREVRELLRRLGAEGRTVLVSSHLLSEVEQACDAVAILRRGRCVAAGRVEDVLGTNGDGLVVKVDDLAAAARVLRQAGITATVEDRFVAVGLAPADAARVTEVLAAKRLWVTELRPKERNLEELFLELTGDIQVPTIAPRVYDLAEEISA
jgi:ABC-2 type transport system ATP-binding protein